ncbi:hypothetical protein [Psychrobacter sp. CAL346-MNA-CIBAN-0220]|uniref:hypothetical protein n=1 Tax=Psychrobacter sp. CAL346-MNA-CIBAN-0220 TaxID=3140457 RepID=UPI0033321988
MTDQVDNWHKLVRYDTNMQGELHANLLRNNNITVSIQALSGIPGMNSGAVLWVQDIDLAHAQRILSSIDTDSAALLDEMTDEAFDDMSDAASNNITSDNNGGTINKGGNA